MTGLCSALDISFGNPQVVWGCQQAPKIISVYVFIWRTFFSGESSVGVDLSFPRFSSRIMSIVKFFIFETPLKLSYVTILYHYNHRQSHNLAFNDFQTPFLPSNETGLITYRVDKIYYLITSLLIIICNLLKITNRYFIRKPLNQTFFCEKLNQSDLLSLKKKSLGVCFIIKRHF